MLFFLLIKNRSIVILLVSIALISTGVELCKRRQNSKSKTDSTEYLTNQSKSLDILLAFSLIRNSRILFSKNEKFAALDTIRLLMILNIHFGHIYQYTTSVGLGAVKKIFSHVFHIAFEDNSFVFARTPLPVDVLITLRLRFNEKNNNFLTNFNSY